MGSLTSNSICERIIASKDTSAAAAASVIVGTAGHIDHGKTTLVRALTGVDCDRLDEEKQRGITIVLGFAPLDLPGGLRVGVVDVPGHERFVRTMVAGAGGVDVALLVVAADEGVMPQTREHLDVLRLLRVPELVVALTRTDLVDEELLELAELDARDLLEGTPWEAAPMVGVSAVTGEGVEGLRQALADAVARLPPPVETPVFRMPVDRSFSIRGFGTVVTGTTRDGALDGGGTLEVLPGREKIRIRGIQVHGQDAARVGRGQRVALNLQGVDSKLVPAGSWLASPGAVACSDRLDITFDLLADTPRPLDNNARVRLLLGTAEVLATVRLMDPDGGPAPESVLPGARGLAQLALEEEIGAVAGDRFVLRAESPVITLGGGSILDPEPPLLRRRERGAAARLHAILADPDAPGTRRVAALLERHVGDALAVPELRRRLPLSAGDPAQDAAAAGGEVVAVASDPPSWVWAGAIARWSIRAQEVVDRHHAAHPLLDGPLINEVRQALVPPPTPRVLDALLGRLCATAGVERRGPRLARPNHAALPDPAAEQALAALVARLEEGGFHPPKMDDAALGLALPPDAIGWLVAQGRLVRVTDDFYVAAPPFAKLVRDLAAFMQDGQTMTPVDFKEISGLTRRHAMPFLEYLDREKVTVRRGNERTLGPGSSRWLETTQPR